MPARLAAARGGWQGSDRRVPVQQADGAGLHLGLDRLGDLDLRELALLAGDVAEGGELLGILDHDWCESHYYLDPNGILIELCRDTPGMPTDAARARELLTAVPEADTPQAESRLVDHSR